MSTSLKELDVTFIFFEYTSNDTNDIEQGSTYTFDNNASLETCEQQVKYTLECILDGREPKNIKLER